MSVFLIIVGALATYLTAGAALARRRYALRYRDEMARQRREFPSLWRDESERVRFRRRARDNANETALGTLLFWPFVIASTEVGKWLHAPIERDEQRVADLRRDADAWDEKRRNGTEAEREMAAELARMCREQADELERSL